MFSEETMLVTGGSGLLGTALKKIFPRAIYPGKEDFNICDLDQITGFLEKNRVETIFHGAAFTSPPKVDKEPIKAIDVNIIGTSNIVKVAAKFGCKVVYISTDYVFKGDKGNYKEDEPVFPVNNYAWSKLGGECAVRLYDNSLIIRTTFGPDVFPYEKAFTDQWTSRESVSKTAQMIKLLLEKDSRGVVHVAGDRKTVHEYAIRLSPDKNIGGLSINDVNFKVPKDTSLNNEHFKKLIS